MKRILLAVLLIGYLADDVHSQTWSNVGNGLDWNVYDLITFDDTLYAAGRLGAPSRGVFYWDGTDWVNTSYFWGIFSPLTLAEYNNDLYTSGDFNGNNGDPTRVFKWTGESWEKQGDNFTGGDWNSVKKLLTHEGFLYAGGQFEIADGIACKNIARWDGTNWTPVSTGIPDLIVNMDVLNNNLIVNHIITDFSNNPNTNPYIRQKLQVLENNIWVDLDSVFEYKNIHLIGVIEDQLYFSTYDTISGIPINGLGVWNGNTFSSLGSDLIYSVNDITKFNNEIYISSLLYTDVQAVFDDVVLKKVNNSWESIGGVFDNRLLKLHVHDSNLYAAGFFKEYENIQMPYVAQLVQKPTALFEIEVNIINFYPNPFKEDITVISENHPIRQIELFSIQGKSLMNWNFDNRNEIELKLQGLPNGVYNLILTTSNGVQHRKIIKH